MEKVVSLYIMTKKIDLIREETFLKQKKSYKNLIVLNQAEKFYNFENFLDSRIFFFLIELIFLPAWLIKKLRKI